MAVAAAAGCRAPACSSPCPATGAGAGAPSKCRRSRAKRLGTVRSTLNGCWKVIPLVRTSLRCDRAWDRGLRRFPRSHLSEEIDGTIAPSLSANPEAQHECEDVRGSDLRRKQRRTASRREHKGRRSLHLLPGRLELRDKTLLYCFGAGSGIG